MREAGACTQYGKRCMAAPPEVGHQQGATCMVRDQAGVLWPRLEAPRACAAEVWGAYDTPKPGPKEVRGHLQGMLQAAWIVREELCV